MPGVLMLEALAQAASALLVAGPTRRLPRASSCAASTTPSSAVRWCQATASASTSASSAAAGRWPACTPPPSSTASVVVEAELVLAMLDRRAAHRCDRLGAPRRGHRRRHRWSARTPWSGRTWCWAAASRSAPRPSSRATPWSATARTSSRSRRSACSRRTSSTGASATRLVIGRRNVFREFVTIHRGTAGGGGETTIGDHNLFMAYAHIAHDCHVGSDTIFGNWRDPRRPRHGRGLRDDQRLFRRAPVLPGRPPRLHRRLLGGDQGRAAVRQDRWATAPGSTVSTRSGWCAAGSRRRRSASSSAPIGTCCTSKLNRRRRPRRTSSRIRPSPAPRSSTSSSSSASSTRGVTLKRPTRRADGAGDRGRGVKLGLIAGNGRFPFLVLDAARSMGHDDHGRRRQGGGVARPRSAAAATPGVALHRVSLGQLGRCLDVLRRRRRDPRGDGRPGEAHEDLRRDARPDVPERAEAGCDRVTPTRSSPPSPT